MVWAKLDDEILDNEKISRAGVLGFALHVAAITWCCRNLTDGFIPRAKARLLLDFSGLAAEVHHACPPGSPVGSPDDIHIDADLLAEELIGCELWRRDQAKDGYWIHDFLDYNPSREEVLKKRDKEASKKRAARESGQCPPGSPVGTQEGTQEGTPQGNLPSPDPDPVPKEPPSGGSYARAHAGSVSEIRPRVAYTVGLDDPLPDKAREVWETVTGNRPIDRPIADVWLGFCGQNAGQTFPTHLAVMGRWQKWLGDQAKYDEERRHQKRDREDAAQRRRDGPPPPPKPTPEQAKRFADELAKRVMAAKKAAVNE